MRTATFADFTDNLTLIADITREPRHSNNGPSLRLVPPLCADGESGVDRPRGGGVVRSRQGGPTTEPSPNPGREGEDWGGRRVGSCVGRGSRIQDRQVSETRGGYGGEVDQTSRRPQPAARQTSWRPSPEVTRTPEAARSNHRPQAKLRSSRSRANPRFSRSWRPRSGQPPAAGLRFSRSPANQRSCRSPVDHRSSCDSPLEEEP